MNNPGLGYSELCKFSSETFMFNKRNGTLENHIHVGRILRGGCDNWLPPRDGGDMIRGGGGGFEAGRGTGCCRYTSTEEASDPHRNPLREWTQCAK